MKNLQIPVLLMVTTSIVAAGYSDDPVNEGKDEAEIHSAFRPVLEKPSKSKADKLVKAGVFPFYNKLPRGEKCPVAIELDVKEGWHIHANPAHPDYTIPTEVKLKTDHNIKLTKVNYPEHKSHRMKGESEDSHVYNGKVTILVLLEIDAGEEADVAKLEFEVDYQACNHEQCRRPNKVVIRGEMSVAAPGDEIKKINQEKFEKRRKKNDTASN